MVKELDGQVAVVTGASRGIGAATATALAAAGADVASLHLPDPDHQRAIVDSIEQLGRRAYFVEGTTSDEATVEAFASSVERDLGEISVWVNNAAVLHVSPYLETDPADWARLLDTNLHGYRNGCFAALHRMTSRHRGRIVNLASVTDIQPIAGLADYITTKGAIVGLTRALALEFAPLGIAVNAVSPGAIVTSMTEAGYTPEVRAAVGARVAMGHVGTAEEIADAVVYLASDSAGYIIGHELVVDGGMWLNGNIPL
jgi:3-oxoacyl-[acyl-carrier protein] reductase